MPKVIMWGAIIVALVCVVVLGYSAIVMASKFDDFSEMEDEDDE